MSFRGTMIFMTICILSFLVAFVIFDKVINAPINPSGKAIDYDTIYYPDSALNDSIKIYIQTPK